MSRRVAYTKGDLVMVNGKGRLPGLKGTAAKVIKIREGGRLIECRASGLFDFVFAETPTGLSKVSVR